MGQVNVWRYLWLLTVDSMVERRGKRQRKAHKQGQRLKVKEEYR